MPENVIEQALDQVADRTPIDWDALERSLNSADERRWLDCVRVLEDIAAFHFADGVDDAPAPGRAGVVEASTTRPGRQSEATTVDGEWWGRYRLDQKVGEGAFGCVYRAWDPELEREVAVKILHKRVAETRLKQALLREGRALAKVRHPNVVSVLSVESHEDQVALCMEFVYGETLEDVLARGPLSPGEAMLVCQDVCRALAAVHLAGFVHQDVKARNVMREKAGRIVLMDFGAGQDVSLLAGVGSMRVAGTPLYMAPEVLAGEPPSATSDVYSVGVLLYHLVSGEYPVEAQSLDGIRSAHMQGRRRLLSERRPALPVTFLQVVDKALASDPALRYASAAQFLEALVGVADTVKKVEPVPTWSPLVRGVTAVLAVLLVALAVGFILSLEFNHALGRTEFVRETPLTWLIWGLRSWLGTVIALLVYGLGASALLVVRLLTMRISPGARALEATAVSFVKSAGRRVGLNDPTVLVCVAVLAAGLSLVGGFWYFQQLLATLNSEFSTAPREALELLSPHRRLDYHELYRKVFTGIVIFAGFAWYASWRLARRRHDALHIAIAAGAGVVFLLALIFLSYPFRVIYQNKFDAVRWEGADCYAIGERQEDLLLFCPALQPPRNRVIKKGSAGLEYAGRVENIFTPFQPAAPLSGAPGQ
jgi:hypothetical protein